MLWQNRGINGNLSNLSCLMISVALLHRCWSGQHMPLVSDERWLQAMVPDQFITNSQSRPRLHFPPQRRKYGWHDYPTPLALCIIHLILHKFFIIRPHPTGNNCPPVEDFYRTAERLMNCGFFCFFPLIQSVIKLLLLKCFRKAAFNGQDLVPVNS